MVTEIIEWNRAEIAALCRKYRVRALWVFGSAATEAWDPATSDIDFLVDLGEYDDLIHHRFFGLPHDLENLLDHPVDLVTVNSIDNPYLRQEIDATKVRVYGPEDAGLSTSMLSAGTTQELTFG